MEVLVAPRYLISRISSVGINRVTIRQTKVHIRSKIEKAAYILATRGHSESAVSKLFYIFQCFLSCHGGRPIKGYPPSIQSTIGYQIVLDRSIKLPLPFSHEQLYLLSQLHAGLLRLLAQWVSFQ